MHVVVGAVGKAIMHDGRKRLRVGGLELCYDVFNLAALSFQFAFEDPFRVLRRPDGNAGD